MTRILLVDDEPAVRQVLVRRLRAEDPGDFYDLPDEYQRGQGDELSIRRLSYYG